MYVLRGWYHMILLSIWLGPQSSELKGKLSNAFRSWLPELWNITRVLFKTLPVACKKTNKTNLSIKYQWNVQVLTDKSFFTMGTHYTEKIAIYRDLKFIFYSLKLDAEMLYIPRGHVVSKLFSWVYPSIALPKTSRLCAIIWPKELRFPYFATLFHNKKDLWHRYCIQRGHDPASFKHFWIPFISVGE